VSFESEPVRGSRPVVRRRRRRGALVPTLVVLGALIVLALVLAGVWTDVLWYSQLGYVSVYRTEVLAQVVLFVLGGLVMAGAVLGCLVLAYRSRPVYVPTASESSGIERYREAVEPLRRLVVLAVPIVLGLFAGSAVAGQWQTVLLWWNGVSFGTNDPQFGLDVGFFVFTLPFLEFLVGFLTAVVVLAAIASVVAHYLYGGLRLQGPGPRFTPAARVHLSVLAAAFLFLRAVDYWLGRYDLAVSDSGRITGLSYTDAHATLTAKGTLAGIALIVAVLFVVGALAGGPWRSLPIYGVVGLLVSAIIIGGIYPAIVQRFQVTPSAQTLEVPYIQRNITATRAAYGLESIKLTPYQAQTTATPSALREDADTIPGIRLIDPTIVSDAFRQLQQSRQYYTFPDSLDVDRYTVNGTVRDSVVSVRELNLEGNDQRNWYNDHIVYTHGFGLVAAYGNRGDTSGNPDFYESGLPSSGALGAFEPRIYFGENSSEYSIVGGPKGSPQRELDYPNGSASGQANTTYAGEGGVSLGPFVNRLLYAIKFREQNLLLSDAVTAQSQIMYDRSPRDRVEKVAPYLTLDGDPYPSVVDGHIVWILDGYTTTNQYPYSQSLSLRDTTQDSVTENKNSVKALDGDHINYVRNSVKATVDAYSGAVSLYAWDAQDPMLRAWQKIFPGTLKPLSAMSGQLLSHVRYPEDLFKVQRTVLAQYHVTDPNSFFGGQDFWQVPNDPTDQTASAGAQPPYYLTLQMPGQDKAAFSLTGGFIPKNVTSSVRNVLTGYLAVDSDAGSTVGQRRDGYGTLRLLQLPKNIVVPAPGSVQNTFKSNPGVSSLLNVLGLQGTKLQYGNLLTLPLAGGLLYVQPVYVSASTPGSFPQLQRVLVAFGNQVGFASTLQCALDQVFQPGSSTTQQCTASQTGTSGQGSGGTPTPTPTPSGSAGATPSPSPSTGAGNAAAQLQQALADANQAIADGQAALAKGDFAGYGQAQARLKQDIARALAAQKQLGITSSGASSPPTRSPAPSPSQ
jgi:uncharacterized membrane protein (UPF0182 family)